MSNKHNALKYKIKELLILNNKSQTDLARFLEVSPNTVNNWCNTTTDSNSSIPGDMLLRTAFYFDTSVEKLHHQKHFELLNSYA